MKALLSVGALVAVSWWLSLSSSLLPPRAATAARVAADAGRLLATVAAARVEDALTEASAQTLKTVARSAVRLASLTARAERALGLCPASASPRRGRAGRGRPSCLSHAEPTPVPAGRES